LSKVDKIRTRYRQIDGVAQSGAALHRRDDERRRTILMQAGGQHLQIEGSGISGCVSRCLAFNDQPSYGASSSQLAYVEANTLVVARLARVAFIIRQGDREAQLTPAGKTLEKEK
jgi:hypothetical protein